MHCGAEVTESSTNKQHHLSSQLEVRVFVILIPSTLGVSARCVAERLLILLLLTSLLCLFLLSEFALSLICFETLSKQGAIGHKHLQLLGQNRSKQKYVR